MSKKKQQKQIILISKLLRSNFENTSITKKMNQKSFKRKLKKIESKAMIKKKLNPKKIKHN